jgi:hypothetical protein
MNEQQHMSERFERFIHRAELHGWELTIDEFVERFRESETLSAEYCESALQARLKSDFRKFLNRARTEDGLPRFFSVLVDDPRTGKRVPRFKQLCLFSQGDYGQSWLQADRREKRARRVKRGREDRFTQRWPRSRGLRERMKGRRDAGQGGGQRELFG